MSEAKQSEREPVPEPGPGPGRMIGRLAHRALRGINALGRLALNDGRTLVRLDRETLLEKSRAATGLDDFGDHSFLEPLELLLRSFEEDARLNLAGRVTVHCQMVRLLCNRLFLQADRELFPEITREKIARPIVITGLPRSGTTFLHGILSQDPRCRAPRVWEVMYPSPPPERASYPVDPRIRRSQRALGLIDVLMPEFQKCHTIGACLPQECIAITDHSFLSYLFESMYYVTSYRNWHDAQDKLPAYQYHRQFLQHLQWRCPGSHWVLKAPSHLMALNALFQVYPDAQVVMTHRDPLKVLPSCASFAKVLRAPFTGAIDVKQLGAEVSRRWADSARQATGMRAGRKDLQGQFFDVSYPDLVRDPMAVARAIYRHFGRELTAEAQEAMRDFIVRHPKDKRGVHFYSLRQFGLDPASERRNFREYLDYFGVATEL